MRSVMRRIGHLSLAAVLLVGLVPGVVTATPWTSGCSRTASSNVVCNFSDSNFGGVWGNWSGSRSNYSGDTYNSSTSISVNDSVSSMGNYYGSQDVIWYHEPNASGGNVCGNPNWEFSWPGLFHNDAFSSHVVAADANACS